MALLIKNISYDFVYYVISNKTSCAGPYIIYMHCKMNTHLFVLLKVLLVLL